MDLFLGLFGGSLAKVAFLFLEKLIFRGKASAEDAKIINDLARVLREKNIAQVEPAYEAKAKQLQDNAEEWKRIKDEKPN